MENLENSLLVSWRGGGRPKGMFCPVQQVVGGFGPSSLLICLDWSSVMQPRAAPPAARGAPVEVPGRLMAQVGEVLARAERGEAPGFVDCDLECEQTEQ